MTSEKNLQDYLLKKAKFNNIYARKVVAVGHTGFPDVMLVVYGNVLFVELKSPTGKGRLSKKQEKEIERLRNEGINVYVIDSYAGADDVIKNLADS